MLVFSVFLSFIYIYEQRSIKSNFLFSKTCSNTTCSTSKWQHQRFLKCIPITISRHKPNFRVFFYLWNIQFKRKWNKVNDSPCNECTNHYYWHLRLVWRSNCQLHTYTHTKCKLVAIIRLTRSTMLPKYLLRDKVKY